MSVDAEVEDVLPQNPFVVESPEKLSLEHLVKLFVPEYTRVQVLQEQKHTFLWGSRGSGKSMMFRYLEPSCQIIAFEGLQKYLENNESFLGVYCPIKEGQINKTDLGLLTDSAAAIMTEHLLNMLVADRVLQCLRFQFPEGFFSAEDLRIFVRRVLRYLDPSPLVPALEKGSAGQGANDQPLEYLQEVISSENAQISSYLRMNALRGEQAKYGGATTGYHDFLLPFMKSIQEISGLNKRPIFVLLDDADRLTQAQQKIVNGWLANRDHSILCFKISSQPRRWETHLTPMGGLIEQPHDYSEIDTDEIYTRSKSDYEEKVRLISERRLELSNVPTKSIVEFLPTDPGEDELFESIRNATGEEWEREGKPGRKSDYVYRYATARLFQRLGEMKRRKSYAGFQNIVHLSSGVVRDFLEPCYLMFDQLISAGNSADSIQAIPPVTQTDVLFKYSEEFFLSKPEEIRKDLPPQEWTHVDSLVALINSLGRLFYARLHDRASREARLFSFTIRGQVPEEVQNALDLGVLYRYFQMRTYSTKEGGGREPWYVLNRRLCPVLGLDPTGFEGRISLTSNHLEIAIKEPERFVRLRLRQEAPPEVDQLPLFILTDME